MQAQAERDGPETAARKGWMSVLAQAPAPRLMALWDGLGAPPEHAVLRPPEIGAVMVRGRAGGDGAAFNLGEMTVTRCSVRLATGEVGHAWRPGRDREAARAAALADALLQGPQAARVEAALVAPLRAEAEAKAREAAEK
ncbi:MAG: phosphonate C-P lyase system protein PhnG, partial [Pseudomonadota bacterium]